MNKADASKRDELDATLEKLYNLIYSSTGNSKHGMYSSYLSGIDNVKNTVIESDISNRGYIFFGRPILNLADSSLKQDRILSLLNTTSTNTLAFSLRCWLDPIFADRTSLIKVIRSSNIINPDLPFIPLLSNTLKTLSGWPDPVMNTDTTEGGFFSESLTFAKGFDELRKSVTLSASFRDIQGSPVLSLFTIWFRFIHLVTRGIVLAYNKYIEERKICYSMSIYRFVLDSSGKFIKYWGKATGCFPVSYPIGGYLNYEEGDIVKNLGNNVSIPFTVNMVEMMDPIILNDFNMLMNRFCSNIKNMRILKRDELVYNNFKSIPYIDTKDGSNELQWRIDEDDYNSDPFDTTNKLYDDFKKEQTRKELNTGV